MNVKKINFGYIYLSLIPIYALIYTLLPEGYINYGDLENSFLMNLYLSAVTVTTLGYGDITPIKETAAILVGTEAVLGVVLIGMFLNQLSHKRSQIDKKAEREMEILREKFHECDKLLQFAAVIKRTEDENELETSVRDFILNIDMHDWKVLERICVIYVTEGDTKSFKDRFNREIVRIEAEYTELKKKLDGNY